MSTLIHEDNREEELALEVYASTGKVITFENGEPEALNDPAYH